ncbi:MAG: DUF72 domain-containing protein [Candidatus Lokiarchaeota archaeon]|nr:DUF72 domain-containing protein [Candidatus Lokiarchaeota archaeon]
MRSNILIGTSGWGYNEWVGPFYPKSFNSKDFLLYYSQIYYTNEINTSFYNIPSKWVVISWVKRTPNDFFFTAKLPKIITHKYKLDISNTMEHLNSFLDAFDPLIQSKKLLSFLIQLPPSFTKDEHFNNLREFIDNWPQERKEQNYYLAVEFRHDSWMDNQVFEYLKKKKLTYCSVVEPLLPPRMDVTNPEFAYIRFHGYGKKIWFDYCFSDEEIKQWAIKIQEVISKAKIVGVYFNNHFSGYATKNSLSMIKELGLKPRIEPKHVNLLEIKKESGKISKGQRSINDFFK